jgi:hypothetical protein
LRRWRKDIETLCENDSRRSAKDIASIGASRLRRTRKDNPIYEDKTWRSAKDIPSIGANISRRPQKSFAMNRATSPRQSPEATSQLFANPGRPNTQARPRNSPQRNDCYTYARTVASASRESITMVARYHHFAIWFAQFGHDLALTSARALLRRGECATRSKPEGSGAMYA